MSNPFVKLSIGLLSALLLFSGCKKGKEIYTPEINAAITTQSVALTTLYELVNFHLLTAEGVPFYTDHCFSRSADTIGTVIFDTMVVNLNGCYSMKANISSGSYTSRYKTSFPAVLDTAVMVLNFKTNGVVFQGELKYFYQTPSMIRISTSTLSVTDPKGKAYALSSDLYMMVGSATNTFDGAMHFTGTYAFDWTSTHTLSGINDFGFQNSELDNLAFTSGKAVFSFPDKSINEDFGDGQDDDVATLTDETGVRKILILPRL